MAWNEPGGSGKKDPWGGGNGDQGPPDLDEIIKNIQRKIGGLFGGVGSSSSGGGGSSSGANAIGLGAVVIVAIVVWVLSGIYIIEEGRRGVILQFGKYLETTLPGPHWYPRFIQSYEEVDISNIRDVSFGYRASGTARGSATKVDRESLMLTQDENIIEVQLAVQYKVKSASDFLFKVKDPEITLREATESALREIIGKSKMDFVLTEGRTQIAAQLQILLQNILDLYETGLEVTSVNMQDAQPPEQVQAAFEDAVKAREDNARLKNEAEAYSNDIIPRAHGKASRVLAEANAYKEKVIAESTGETQRFLKVLAEYKKAPKVTRKRLYIESMESVLANTSKVIVDVKGNNILYLPLDRAAGDNKMRNVIPPLPPLSSSDGQQSDSRQRQSSRGGR